MTLEILNKSAFSSFNSHLAKNEILDRSVRRGTRWLQRINYARKD